MEDDEQKNYWQQQPSETPGISPAAPPAAPEEASSEAPQGTPSDTPPGTSSATSAPSAPDDAAAPITWTAHEHIDAMRGPLWFVVFFIVVAALVAFSILLLRSWSFSLLIVVMAIAFIIYLRRPAQELTYAVSPQQGVYVGENLHPFSEFKAFGILQDGEHNSVVLLPRQRFAPGVSLYFPTEVGERLVDMLGEHLPMETVKLDVVDAIVRKLRM